MSSILKALRKLEHEKSAMGEGSVDLARDILKRSYEERRRSWSGPVVVVGAALLLVVFGWWLMSSPAPETIMRQADLPLPQATEAAAPVPPVVSQKKPQQLSPVIIMPNRTLLQRGEGQSKAQQKEPLTALTGKAVPVAGAGAAALVIPDLVIDEIVFVADPSARLAVINDLPVMQGTDIAGARVIEILADRVRFEFKGVRFDKFKASAN